MSRKRGYIPQTVSTWLAAILGVSAPSRLTRLRRGAARIGQMIRLCPGRRHAWFESDCGSVRKPVERRVTQ